MIKNPDLFRAACGQVLLPEIELEIEGEIRPIPLFLVQQIALAILNQTVDPMTMDEIERAVAKEELIRSIPGKGTQVENKRLELLGKLLKTLGATDEEVLADYNKRDSILTDSEAKQRAKEEILVLRFEMGVGR